MTRITFLIGNGFDLNVGLKTKYRDFYEYYIAKQADDLLASAIGGDYLFWADLELGLGRYTEKVNVKEEAIFWKSEQKLERELINFLEGQMNRVNLKDEEREMETALEMQRSLTEFYKELPEVQTRKIYDIYDKTREKIFYSFITFNYTDVLDRCIGAALKFIPTDFGKHNSSGGLIYEHAIGDVLHIHGTINADMVLGVNDENQITNKEFLRNDLYRQLLIKEETNKRFGKEKSEKAQKIIDESIIICIFGMSIGRTDKIWWQYICHWLEAKPENMLIIYIKIEGENKWLGKYDLFSMEDKILNRLKNNASISDEVWDRIKDQIYVKCNTGIFNFKIVDK